MDFIIFILAFFSLLLGLAKILAGFFVYLEEKNGVRYKSIYTYNVIFGTYDILIGIYFLLLSIVLARLFYLLSPLSC